MYELKKSVCFIGMPSSGKTTLARNISQKYHFAFEDLDEFIELNSGCKIHELWKIYGEIGFRSIERYYLLGLLNSSAFVLSSGGGTPCFFNNLHWIKQFCFTIYLDTEKPYLSQAINTGKHPLFDNVLHPEQEWLQLLYKRQSFYKSADLILKKDSIEPNPIEAVIQNCLQNNII